MGDTISHFTFSHATFPLDTNDIFFTKVHLVNQTERATSDLPASQPVCAFCSGDALLGHKQAKDQMLWGIIQMADRIS